jgi:hypothetical protein
VDFLFYNGRSGTGKVVGPMANDRYEIEIILPKYRKGDHIDVDVEDIFNDD